MKKILSVLLIFSLFILGYQNTFAGLNNKEKKKIDRVVKKIEKVVNQKSIKLKDKYIYKINRILQKKKKSSKSYQILNYLLVELRQINLTSLAKKHYSQYNINYSQLQSYWLDLHNSERKRRGVQLYSYDNRLNNTAYQWSYSMGERGVMDHKRKSNDGYYDYPVVENWFQERGVKCKVINGLTTSESIAKHSFYCVDGDCSEQLKAAMKQIFDVYMAEEGLSYPSNAHFRGIVHPNISKMGLGFFFEKTPDQKKWKNFYDFYVTTHYCSDFIQ